jgi:hypothetical protein
MPRKPLPRIYGLSKDSERFYRERAKEGLIPTNLAVRALRAEEQRHGAIGVMKAAANRRIRTAATGQKNSMHRKKSEHAIYVRQRRLKRECMAEWGWMADLDRPKPPQPVSLPSAWAKRRRIAELAYKIPPRPFRLSYEDCMVRKAV